MQISVLVISNNELIATKKNDSCFDILSNLHKNGFIINSQEYIKIDYSNICNRILNGLSQNDCILLLVENQIEASFVTKKAIAKLLSDELAINEYAKNNIDEYFKVNNLPYTKEGNTESFMPRKGRCITNPLGIMQGGLYEIDGNKQIIMMPLEHMQLHNMFVSSVLPYLLAQANQNANTYIFKTFGLTQAEILSLLKEMRKNKHKINIICNEKLLDGEIIIENNPRVKQENTDSIVRGVFSRLANNVYSEGDYSLTEVTKDLLLLNKYTFSTAEDITAGRVASEFYKNNDESRLLLPEGYIATTNLAKTKLLGVDKQTLARTNSFADIGYEMALGALENSGTDFVVSTTGCLDKNNIDEYGHCAICVGNIKGINVYKHIFSGSRDEIIDKATNAAFFHLIKKMKQKDFHFDKTSDII